jgi:hypothetical protein
VQYLNFKLDLKPVQKRSLTRYKQTLESQKKALSLLKTQKSTARIDPLPQEKDPTPKQQVMRRERPEFDRTDDLFNEYKKGEDELLQITGMIADQSTDELTQGNEYNTMKKPEVKLLKKRPSLEQILIKNRAGRLEVQRISDHLQLQQQLLPSASVSQKISPLKSPRAVIVEARKLAERLNISDRAFAITSETSEDGPPKVYLPPLVELNAGVRQLQPTPLKTEEDQRYQRFNES